MNYGYFDVENHEYVVTRPDTPTPWINYLGNGGFGGFVSNNAGGLSFNGDPGKRRLTRYRFNNLPMDRPGRYVYIRDMDTNEYWSPTWQPVMKTPELYECRHGLSYTTIKTVYNNIEFEVTYFVPQKKSYELWKCKITNNNDETKNLKLFPYVEFSLFDAQIDNMMEWGRYGMCGGYENGTIIYSPASVEFINEEFHGFISTTLEQEGFDCARDKFIGTYRSEQNPIALENGCCSDSHIDADHVCGAFACPVKLAAGEMKEFVVAVGATSNKSEIPAMVKEALCVEAAEKELNNIKAMWNNHLEFCQIDTPDEDMNKMINIWHAYQCKTTFDWSRYISYYERGSDRGWGFRDSMQDVLGVMHAIPMQAKERIKTLLKLQGSDGNAKSVYYPGTGEAKGGGRSDDHLWSIYSVCTYIKETGDYAFLDEQVPYINGGSGTVVEHLMCGLEFTRNNLGEHGIPKFLLSDWNDSISSIGWGGKSESVFVFFQAAAGANYLRKLFAHIGDETRQAWAEEYYEWCRSVYKTLWDGEWFIRAFTNEGEKLGTNADEYNKIFLNPQSWAVLSELPTEEEGKLAFDNVMKYLFTKYGLISHYPASSGFDPKNKTFFSMHKGVKENGGVFCHANTWAVIAETMLNRADEAYKIYKATLPCNRNETAEVSLIEPYVYASAQLGPAHERFGAASNSWLTGTASWMYFAATQYILGFRPEYDGLLIDPCVPDEWNGFKMSRNYRGIKCDVTVNKLPCKGAKPSNVVVNGEKIEGNYIPFDCIKDCKVAEIVVEYN